MSEAAKTCTCHRDGTCRCLENSTRAGRGELYCSKCGETDEHCPCGCTCQEEE